MQPVQQLELTSALTPKFVEVLVSTLKKPTTTPNLAFAHIAQSNSDDVLHKRDFTLEINNLLSPKLLGMLIQVVPHA